MSEFDDTLTRLFAEDRQPLPAEEFVQSVATHVSHARRRRAIGRTALTVAAGGVAIAATPYVAAETLAAVSRLGEWLPALANALPSPVIWLCSVAVAAWSLRRARRMS